MKVTQKYMESLKELGVETPIKALYSFPKNTIFIEQTVFTPDMNEGVFEGVISSKPSMIRSPRSSFVRFNFTVDSGHVLPLICFNQQYLLKVLEPNMRIIVAIKKAKRNWVVSRLFYRNLDEIGVESTYPLLKGMQQKRYRKYVQDCLDFLTIENFLPGYLHEKYRLIPRKQAFQMMHFPENKNEKEQALRYFKYEEAFLFQLNLIIRKIENKTPISPKVIEAEIDDLAPIISQLSFELTGSQQKVIEEVLNDFLSDKIMQRLLQGDVGSGKTVVSLLIAYIQIINGYQVAMLAPTTILAEQHLDSSIKLFLNHGISIGLLRSQMKKADREIVLEKLASGEIDLIIGTHALIEPDVRFHKLGLAIIDEQQRFGVEQRKALKEKADNVDMLYMTATPIPRTLAMSVFGDLDVSTIDELPAGRQAIETKVIPKKRWKKVQEKIETTIANGEQVYVVCPLIEESENFAVSNLIEVYEDLKTSLPENIQVGMLHGKQSQDEKSQAILEFSNKKIDVLVSTTVIEVGVHVDDATLMVIVDAQQFGLSQLHQLRGRIGRNALKSTCMLVSDADNERLKIMEQSQDGFYLAQEDLKLRGPGDFFGEKQSGIPTFQVLNIVEDFSVLDYATKDVHELMSNEKLKEQYPKIQQYIDHKKENISDYLA